jgi:hypothetical protein
MAPPRLPDCATALGGDPARPASTIRNGTAFRTGLVKSRCDLPRRCARSSETRKPSATAPLGKRVDSTNDHQGEMPGGPPVRPLVEVLARLDADLLGRPHERAPDARIGSFEAEIAVQRHAKHELASEGSCRQVIGLAWALVLWLQSTRAPPAARSAAMPLGKSLQSPWQLPDLARVLFDRRVNREPSYAGGVRIDIWVQCAWSRNALLTRS